MVMVNQIVDKRVDQIVEKRTMATTESRVTAATPEGKSQEVHAGIYVNKAQNSITPSRVRTDESRLVKSPSDTTLYTLQLRLVNNPESTWS